MNNLITLHNFILLICNKRRFYDTNSESTILLSCWHCARDPIAALCAQSYHSQATVTHVDGGQFIVRKGDRVRLLWSEMGGPHLTQVESKTCCFKRNWRKGTFVTPLTTVWGVHNFLGGDFITAGTRLAGVYPPWFCYEFEGAAPGGVVEMVFVGGK